MLVHILMTIQHHLRDLQSTYHHFHSNTWQRIGDKVNIIMRTNMKKQKIKKKRNWKTQISLRIGVFTSLFFILLTTYFHTYVFCSIKKSPEEIQLENKCWIQKAVATGELKLFSHRTFSNAHLETQPTCQESLQSLKNIGVKHYDIDVVLNDDELIVAHPTEFKRESSYYAPCSNMKFDDFIDLVKIIYHEEKAIQPEKIDVSFFISIEPKAAWDKTETQLQDKALVNMPSDILTKFLQSVKQHELQHQCAVICDIRPKDQTTHTNEEIDKQTSILKEILEYCLHFSGIRISDPVPQSIGAYDYIMPTIEFHPHNPRNPSYQKEIGQSSMIRKTENNEIPSKVLEKSIVWIVDTEEDLIMTSEMRPYGFVSNVPLVVYDILNDKSWC